MAHAAVGQGVRNSLEVKALRSKREAKPSQAKPPHDEQRVGAFRAALIRRGLDALARAESLGGAAGTYVMQAAIAACRARARTGSETDWGRIASLDGTLARLTPSPVIELNRAVAIAPH